MTNPSNEVLAERIKHLEREVQALKNDVRSAEQEIDDIQGDRNLLIHKLDVITANITEIRTTISKDSGWRGFFLDFIKAVAQIAVLVGAGKWIF